MITRKRGSRKAQVTSFIVLGILIVALILLGYAFRDTLFGGIRERGIIKGVTLPIEVSRLEDFIDVCVDEVTESGARILGQQGGYIVLPDPEIVSPVNPFSNSLEIFFGSDTRVAYWFFQEANGVKKSLMPSKEEMEDQLRRYVNANLRNCVDVSNIDADIVFGEVESLVEINENEIDVDVEFQVTINLKDEIFELKDFNQKIKLSLGKLYAVAQAIMSNENENFFLEEKTLDYMNVYDEIPYSGVDFECTPKRWNKQKVIEDFKEILEGNIKSLKIEGTRNSEVDDKYSSLDLLKNVNDVDVNFDYSRNWPFLIDIVPEGEILEGDSFNRGGIGKFLTQFFCINSYHFVYDLKYPVLISLNKNDFDFQFATQIIVENNQPREPLIVVEQSHDTNSIICENPLTTINVNVFGINSNFGLEPVEGAKISYQCSSTVCNIGRTGEFSDLSYFEGKFPQCLNGQLIVEKEGYDTFEEQLSTIEETTITALMEPIYELDLEVKVLGVAFSREVLGNELVSISLKNENENYFENVNIPGSEKIKLIPGSYDVEAYLISDSSVYVEGKDLETCLDIPREGVLGVIGLTKRECQTTKIEGLTLPQVLSGGASFSWNIEREELAENNKVKIFLNIFDVPQDIDELNKIYDEINSKGVAEPEFEK